MAKYNMHDYEKEMRRQEEEKKFQKEVEAKLQSEDYDAEKNWRDWKNRQRLAALERRQNQYDDLDAKYELYEAELDLFFPLVH